MTGNPYGAARIKAGLAHFLFGKLLSSIASIAYFVLLVRLLRLDEFAAYTVMNGLVDVISAISSVGIMHILLRFVPELYGARDVHSLRRLLGRLIAARVGVLVVFLAALAATSDWLAPHIGLAQWRDMFLLYLVVVLLRTLGTVLYHALESMLHQASAQFANTGAAILKLACLLWLMPRDGVDLRAVLLIEIVAEALACVLMAVALRRVMPPPGNERERSVGRRWMVDNGRRMLEFGATAYVQSLLIVPTGGAFDRLLIGGRLPSADIALFGFGQWIYDLQQRFLPAQLFHGLYRPVMNARFSNHRRFEEITMISNLILKLNVILIGAVMLVLLAGGDGLVTFITGGKFGANAVPLAVLMCALMMVMSWRHVLDQACHTVERNEALIWANAVLAASTLPGILALPLLGVYALPLAHMMGGVASNLVLEYRLRRHSYYYRHDFGCLARIGGVLGATCAVSWLLFGHVRLHWAASAAIAVTAYGLSLLAVCRPTADEHQLLRSMIGRRASATGGAGA